MLDQKAVIIWQPRKSRTIEMVNESVVVRCWGEDWKGEDSRYFYDSETMLYDSVMVDPRHRAFVKAYRTLQNKEGILRYSNLKKYFGGWGHPGWNAECSKKKKKNLTVLQVLWKNFTGRGGEIKCSSN